MGGVSLHTSPRPLVGLRSARYPRRSPERVLASSVVPRRGHAPHVLHQRGGPPCLHPQGAALPRRRLIVLRCSARGAAHAKRDQASAPLYAHICSLRRKRLRTAGRRNPRTLPASRPMTNSPSSASSARSASACCRCSARRWPCELLRHVRRCAACPTGVHCDLPNTLSSSPCPCIRTVICDVSLLSRRKLDMNCCCRFVYNYKRPESRCS